MVFQAIASHSATANVARNLFFLSGPLNLRASDSLRFLAAIRPILVNRAVPVDVVLFHNAQSFVGLKSVYVHELDSRVA